MKLTYLGHAAFLLEADGKTVAVDPFLSGNPTASHAAAFKRLVEERTGARCLPLQPGEAHEV